MSKQFRDILLTNPVLPVFLVPVEDKHIARLHAQQPGGFLPRFKVGV